MIFWKRTGPPSSFLMISPRQWEKVRLLKLLEVERDVTLLVRDEPVLDKGSVSSGGADDTEPVSKLNHPCKTRPLGQSRKTTCTNSLQSILPNSDRLTNSRNQRPSCPRCLKSGHELCACPYRAEKIYHLCCERWGTHCNTCRRQIVTRPFLESTTCPRCLQLGHRVHECPAEAVTLYLTCCKQWRSHHSGCVRTLKSKQFSR